MNGSAMKMATLHCSTCDVDKYDVEYRYPYANMPIAEPGMYEVYFINLYVPVIVDCVVLCLVDTWDKGVDSGTWTVTCSEEGHCAMASPF